LTKEDNKFVKNFMGKESYINLLNKFSVVDYLDADNINLDLIQISSTATLRDALCIMISESLEKLRVYDSVKGALGIITINRIVAVLRDGR
jgi:ABC-type proline/glycine betaine transport system ATPase subunit